MRRNARMALIFCRCWIHRQIQRLGPFTSFAARPLEFVAGKAHWFIGMLVGAYAASLFRIVKSKLRTLIGSLKIAVGHRERKLDGRPSSCFAGPELLSLSVREAGIGAFLDGHFPCLQGVASRLRRNSRTSSILLHSRQRY
jgi:hypothetical protein